MLVKGQFSNFITPFVLIKGTLLSFLFWFLILIYVTVGYMLKYLLDTLWIVPLLPKAKKKINCLCFKAVTLLWLCSSDQSLLYYKRPKI